MQINVVNTQLKSITYVTKCDKIHIKAVFSQTNRYSFSLLVLCMIHTITNTLNMLDVRIQVNSLMHTQLFLLFMQTGRHVVYSSQRNDKSNNNETRFSSQRAQNKLLHSIVQMTGLSFNVFRLAYIQWANQRFDYSANMTTYSQVI